MEGGNKLSNKINVDKITNIKDSYSFFIVLPLH